MSRYVAPTTHRYIALCGYWVPATDLFFMPRQRIEPKIFKQAKQV